MIIKGTKVSNGYAIGKVKIIHTQEILVNQKKVDDVIVEFNRVKKAVENVVEKIEAEKILVEDRLNISELYIFDAHITMAQDPEVLSMIKLEIEKNHESAEFSVNKVFDEVIKTFESMDNEYFSQRAEDVLAIKRKILCELLKIEEINIEQITDKVIIASYDLTPSQTARLNPENTLGFITETGGLTSHSAIMAKSLEIPAVLGVRGILDHIKDGDIIIIDGEEGYVIINPTPKEIKLYEKKKQLNQIYKEKLNLTKSLPTTTLDDRKVELAANIADLNDFSKALEVNADGIGLFRTEFIYMDRPNLPSEEEQFLIYKKVLEKMRDKKVVIRTVDIGGDKTLDYLRLPKEMNPFLGLRAIRLCLNQPEIFKKQIRALLRASIYGKLCIMFPMISTVQELIDAKEIVNQTKTELQNENCEVSDNIEIGMMIETPAAAILSEKFAKHIDFFSIGTNDLIQYTLAADRMNEQVSYLYQPLNPAILKLIKMTIDSAHKYNKWVGICGEMASEKYGALLLVGMGADELSMTASNLLYIKDILLGSNYIDLKHITSRCLMFETDVEVINYLKEQCDL
ncbi:phosphoenolpyruvate--protein phosphotransferase [Mycoplasmatota bacterium]|nr:phosphoenolpyruvate--protein phosphotransferase [Mycoplasmatota bacterium]